MVTVDVIIPYSSEHTPREMLDEAVAVAEQQNGVETNVIVVQDDDQNGPAWARNRGLARSTNRFVAYLDGDDLWESDKLQRQIERMQNTGAGLCVATDKEYGSVTDFVKDVALEQVTSLTPSIVVDTEQVDVLWDEEFYRREDHLYLVEAASQTGVCTVDEGVYTVRKHDGGLSDSEDKEKKLEAHREFWEKAVETCSWLKNIERDYWQHCYHRVGRDMYYRGEYRRSAELLMQSIRCKPSVKTLGALGVSTAKWAVS